MSPNAPGRPDNEDTTPKSPAFDPNIDYFDNIQDRRWHRTQILNDNQKPKSLEESWETLHQHFPRIYEMLRMTWGSQEAHNKLAHLLWVDTEARAGFPKEVVWALMAIQAAHQREFGFEQTAETEKTIRDRW